MVPGKYNLPEIRRGDTYPSRNIATVTDKATGDPIAISSARLQIRDEISNLVIYEWSTTLGNMTITGAGNNIVTLGALAIGDTEGFTTGPRHKYDLEITTSDSKTWTILEGRVEIVEDITRD